MNRLQAVVLLALSTAFVPLAAADVPPSHREPSLMLVTGMPDDVQRLVRRTWSRFVQAFPARRACFEPITLEAAWELEDRARYDPARRLVQLRIPSTAPNLEASLVHEFAHHLEFTCPQQVELRRRFLAAQGLSGNERWFVGATWERTPSEQFAEAVAEYVLGARPPHSTTTTSTAAVAVIRSWATAGELNHHP